MRIEVKIAGLALALAAGAVVAQTRPAPVKASPAKPAARDWNNAIALTPQGTHLLGNPAAKVKLRQGDVQPPPAVAGTGRAAPPSLKPIPFELGDSLRDIGDPELRTVLESLARSLGSAAQDGKDEDDDAN